MGTRQEPLTTTGERAPPRARAALVVLLFAAIGAFLLRGAFVDFANLGAKDWNAFAGQAQAEVTSIERDGEFPLWNPWRRGGQVSFAQPESMFVSPVTPLALAIGVLPAFKLLLVPIFVLGCVGAWLLAGAIGLAGAARLVVPLVFFTSGAFPYYVAGGLPNWLFGLALLPWILWCRRRAAADHAFVLLGALAFAGVLCCGSVYQFVFFPLIVGLDACLEAIAMRRVRPIGVAAALLLVGAALSLVRLLPIADVHRVYPRELPATERHLDLSLIASALLSPRHPDLSTVSGTVLLNGENWVSWVTVGCYIGPVFALLALIGFAARARRTWPYLILFAFLAWLSLGAGATPSAWNLVHRLPVLKSMQAPERLLVPSTLFLAIAAAFAVQSIARRSRMLAALVVAVATAIPLLVNDDVAFSAFPEPPSADLPRADAPFVQVRQPPRKTQWGGESYEAVLSNRGNPLAQADVPSPEAVHALGDVSYRGEAWLASGRGSLTARFTANRVHVTAELPEDDVLVVNQNFFPGWEAAGSASGPLIDRGGLLALPLPRGRHDVVLAFHQRSVALGAALSCVALAMCGGVVLIRRRRGFRDAFGLPECSALAGCAVLLGGLALGDRFGPAANPSRATTSSARNEPRVVGPSDAAVAIAAAAPGEVIELEDGDYAGFRLRAGVTVAALHPGRARIKSGSIEIESVPIGPPVALVGLAAGHPGAAITIRACSTGVFLESLDFATAPLTIDHSEPAAIVRSRFGATRVESATVALVDCDLAASDGAPALRVTSGSAIVADGTLRAIGAPAIDADHGRVDFTSDRADAFAADARIRLANGSWFRGSGAGAPLSGDARISRDATSTVDRFDPLLPMVKLDDAPVAGGSIAVTLTGPAGARGVLVIGRRLQLIEVVGTRQFAQLGRELPDLVIPVEIPAAGRLRVATDVARTGLTAGAPLVLQLLLRSDANSGTLAWRGMRASPIAGGVIAPAPPR